MKTDFPQLGHKNTADVPNISKVHRLQTLASLKLDKVNYFWEKCADPKEFSIRWEIDNETPTLKKVVA